MKIKTSALAAFLENTKDTTEPKTVVCMGVPRGGTSMVAGAIAGLGLYMGDNLDVNIEDPDFNPDVNKNQSYVEFLKHLPEVIAQRNATHQAWGWKYPHANRYLKNIFPLLRNPHLVIVFRDPVASAIWSRPQDSDAAISETKRQLDWQAENLKTAVQLKVPTLMVSYERASVKPAEFLEKLCGFIGFSYPENHQKIIDFMAPGKYKNINKISEM